MQESRIDLSLVKPNPLARHMLPESIFKVLRCVKTKVNNLYRKTSLEVAGCCSTLPVTPNHFVILQYMFLFDGFIPAPDIFSPVSLEGVSQSPESSSYPAVPVDGGYQIADW